MRTEGCPEHPAMCRLFRYLSGWVLCVYAMQEAPRVEKACMFSGGDSGSPGTSKMSLE